MSLALQIAACAALAIIFLIVHMRARPVVVLVIDVLCFALLLTLDVIRFAMQPTIMNAILILLIATWIPYSILEYRRQKATT